jgi:hypothetical protein
LVFLGVDSTKNTVNQKAYAPEPSLMHNPHLWKRWDSFHVTGINYYNDSIGFERSIIHDAFPASMGISAESQSGNPLPGVMVNLYKVEWGK